jgi:hypothetical protein
VSELVERLLLLLGGGASVGVVIAILLLLNPEKVEIWSSMLWRALSKIGTFFKSAHKQYVKHDLQGRLNEFSKSLLREAPFLAATRAQVEWTGSEVTRKGFLEEGQVILRLRRDDPEDTNFVHGAYMFVSTSLLFKAKRYISPSQRQAVDLYVTTRAIEQEKPGVVDCFLGEYLHPKLADPQSKTACYYDALAKIDTGGLFYPVLLQELDFLGGKVFGGRQDDKIITEVDSLVDFLQPIAMRTVGEECNLNFERQYCRFAIVIVGKPFKVTPSGEVYVNYIRRNLIPKKIETVYVLSLHENKDVLDAICNAVSGVYDKCRVRESRVTLRYGNAQVERNQCLVILRMKGISVFQPSE